MRNLIETNFNNNFEGRYKVIIVKDLSNSERYILYEKIALKKCQ